MKSASPARRSYGEFCGLARALDVVGDRWALLIVRELLISPRHYGELVTGLPGIATNLLADRLRTLQLSRVIERRVDPDANGILYALTTWGAQLRETVEAMVRWSTPLMAPGPREDIFRPEWLTLALQSLLRDRKTGTPSTVGLEVAGLTLAVHLDPSGGRVELYPTERPHTVLRAEPHVILGLAAGALTVKQAVAAGKLTGKKAEIAAAFGRHA